MVWNLTFRNFIIKLLFHVFNLVSRPLKKASYFGWLQFKSNIMLANRLLIRLLSSKSSMQRSLPENGCNKSESIEKRVNIDTGVF